MCGTLQAYSDGSPQNGELMCFSHFHHSGPPPTLAVARLSHTGPSWADRVKSSQSLPVPSQNSNIPTEKPGELFIFTDYCGIYQMIEIGIA